MKGWSTQSTRPTFEAEGGKVKIKILRDTVCGGKNVKKGQTIDASEKDANELLRIEKAELVGKDKDKDGGKSGGK